jgi:glutaminyl-peptide cyclotransferase
MSNGSSSILFLDPKTLATKGRISGWIDLGGLNPDPQTLKYPFVLNGIAFNEATGRLLVSGKCWPAIYEIEPVPRSR